MSPSDQIDSLGTQGKSCPIILFDPQSPSDPMIPSHLWIQWTRRTRWVYRVLWAGWVQRVHRVQWACQAQRARQLKWFHWPTELFESDKHFPFGFNDPVGSNKPVGTDVPFGSNESFEFEKPSVPMIPLDPRRVTELVGSDERIPLWVQRSCRVKWALMYPLNLVVLWVREALRFQ